MAFTLEEMIFIKWALRDRLGELTRHAFERFFQDLMCARFPDFLDVGTYGNIGDLGADGLSLHDGKLYACYGPDEPDAAAVRSKFRSDLDSAVRQRADQFRVFVFVHNGHRGIHPEVTAMLAEARTNHSELGFVQYGPRHFLDDLIQLRRDQVERVLGREIPVTERVYQVGLADLEPMLAHLAAQRRKVGDQAPAKEVPAHKLDYNQLTATDREELVRALKHTHLVHEYYQNRIDPLERDEVARGITDRYQALRGAYDEPSEIIWKLQEYVSGNARQRPDQEYMIMVLLAYFFETCDLFKEPPADWQPPSLEAAPS